MFPWVSLSFWPKLTMNSQSCVDRESWSGEYELSWCVYSCLMQINKCSVLCTTIMRPVVTEAATAVLTIIFPRGRGQCGVCKMRQCYMFLVSMCSCLNCLLARPNLPVSMFTPRLSIILGHCLHTTATSPARPRMQASENFYNIISNYLGSQKWHNIIVKCPPFHWFIYPT